MFTVRQMGSKHFEKDHYINSQNKKKKKLTFHFPKNSFHSSNTSLTCHGHSENNGLNDI